MNVFLVTNGAAAAGALLEAAGVATERERVAMVGRVVQDAMASYFWFQFAKGAGNAGWGSIAGPSLLMSMSGPAMLIMRKIGYPPADRAAPFHHILMGISNCVFALLSAQALSQQPMQMTAVQVGAFANILPIVTSMVS